MSFVRRALFSACALGTLPLVTCLDPTEVRVKVRTDACALENVDVFLGMQSAPVGNKKVATPQGCVSGSLRDVGTLVFVPSKMAGDRFQMRVEGTLTGGKCSGDMPTKCITARREVGYIKHDALDLTVDLTSDCADVSCRDGYTCNHGNCVPDCAGSGCMDMGDATVPPDDAPITSDGPIGDVAWGEVGVQCIEPGAQVLADGHSITHAWSFDANPLSDPYSMKTAVLTNGNTIKSGGPFGCGNMLAFGTGDQNLGATDSGNGFGAAFYLYLPISIGKTPILRKNYANAGNFTVGVDVLLHVFLSRCTQIQCFEDTTMTSVPTLTWTSIQIVATSMDAVTVWIGGMKSAVVHLAAPTGAYQAGTLTLVPNGFIGANIDELLIFGVP